jgi:alpha-ketoglutarate-dependent taurine dioxygenase
VAVSTDIILTTYHKYISLIGSLVTRSIVGLKKEESEALLGFLLNHIGRGIDYQARVRWAPKTVVVWDVSLLIASVISRNSETDRLTRTVLLCTLQSLIG